jgi:ornithine cyclodeaminase/mu-crystallin family protein
MLRIADCRLDGLRVGRARFLNERPVWGAASSNGNGEDGREADLSRMFVGVPLLARSGSQAEDRFQGASRRTTAASALATKAMAAPGAAVLVVLGTGVQASAGAGLPRVRIWDRSPERTAPLGAEVGAAAHGDPICGSLRRLSTVLRGGYLQAGTNAAPRPSLVRREGLCACREHAAKAALTDVVFSLSAAPSAPLGVLANGSRCRCAAQEGGRAG